MTSIALPVSAKTAASGSSGLALPGNLGRRSSGLAIPTTSTTASAPTVNATASGSGTPTLSSSHALGANGSEAGGEGVAGPSKAASVSKDQDGNQAEWGNEGAGAGTGDGDADTEPGSTAKSSKKRKSISAAAGLTAATAATAASAGTGGAGSAALAPATQDSAVPSGTLAGKEYRYSGEISQMMFVFGEVQDPLLETVRLVEDIVRGQIVEIITRARHLTNLRSSRFLSADDVIFLIRDDRGKVNRLRTYLSWKDVRKKAKDDESGEAGAEVDMDDAEKMTAKIRNTMVKLPWELLTPFSDLLKSLPSSQNREDDEEQDEDEMQAYQDSMQRLRDADEITKKMTKDEYVHYSDCRQASFTYRKAKRFRDFVNFSAYLDTGPNDDIVDILGFLSFEMVRTLCVKSLDVRDRLEKKVIPSTSAKSGTGLTRRNTGRAQTIGTAASVRGSTSSPAKRKAVSNGAVAGDDGVVRMTSPERLSRSRSNDSISPENPPTALPPTSQTQAGAQPSSSAPQPKRQRTSNDRDRDRDRDVKGSSTMDQPISLFAPPPSARQPLLPSHVLEAFAQIQREQVGSRTAGMRNFRGGIMRGKLALV